ncbi:hypothetical protein ACOMHN_050282 [Nucella lapillus]
MRVLLLVLAVGLTLGLDLDAEWVTFKKTFNKLYKNVEDEAYRRTVWEYHLDYIQRHNLEADLGVHSYFLGVNEFADMPNKEFVQRMNGYRVRQGPSSGASHYLAPSNLGDLPDTVDWRTKGYVTPVKNQGQCGSCWAFSSTGSLEGQHFKKSGTLVSLSEQNLVDCSTKQGNQGCDGGLMYEAFNYIKVNGGIDTEASYPYEAEDRKCRFKRQSVGANDTGFVDIKSKSEPDLQSAVATVGPISVAIDASHSSLQVGFVDIKSKSKPDLQRAVATVGPISVAIDASHTSFQLYSHGVYHEPQCSQIYLDHAVLAVGYGKYESKDYWLVKNSWGTTWGIKGYIMMSRNRDNNCGIATEALYPTV